MGYKAEGKTLAGLQSKEGEGEGNKRYNWKGALRRLQIRVEPISLLEFSTTAWIRNPQVDLVKQHHQGILVRLNE